MNHTDNIGGLTPETLRKLREIFLTFPSVSEVILYGSRVKGSYRPGSDIDITLKGETLNTKVIVKLDNMIDDLLLPWIFDISIYDRIKNEDLISHIDRVGITIYRREPAALPSVT